MRNRFHFFVKFFGILWPLKKRSEMKEKRRKDKLVRLIVRFLLCFLRSFVDFFLEYLLLCWFVKDFLNLFLIEEVVQLMMNDYEMHLTDLNLFFKWKIFFSKRWKWIISPEYCRRCCFVESSFNCSTKSFLSSTKNPSIDPIEIPMKNFTLFWLLNIRRSRSITYREFIHWLIWIGWR